MRVRQKKTREKRRRSFFEEVKGSGWGPFLKSKETNRLHTQRLTAGSLFSSFFTNKLHRPRQFEQHGGHPRIGRREDAVLDLERREQQRHLSKPSQGGGRGVRFSRGFAKEGVGESFSHSQGWTRRQSEKVNVTYKREVH